MKNKVKKNTVYNLIKTVSTVIFPLLIFQYVSRKLGVTNVGRVNYGNSIVSYFSLFASLGLTTYAVRTISKITSSKKDLEKTASEIYSINLATTIISYILLFILLLASHSLAEYRTLIVIQSTVILFTTIGADWINMAMEDYKYIAIRTLAFQILSFGLVFLFIHNEDDYLKYAAITVISSSGANIVNYFYRKRFCKLHFVWRFEAKQHLIPIILLFAMQVSQRVYTSSDMTLLGYLRTPYDVGIYSVAVKVYNIVNILVASISHVVLPQISYNYSRSNFKEINQILRYSLGVILLLGVPCAAGVFSLSPEIVSIVSGVEYAEAFYPLRILTIALLFSYFGGFITNIILIPMNGEKKVMYISTICALINISLNIIFIPRFGVVAAAMTTVIAELVSFIICFRFIPRGIRIDNIQNLVIAPILEAISIIAITALLHKIGINNILVFAAVDMVLSLSLYSVYIYVTKNELGMDLIRKIIGAIGLHLNS